MAAAKCQNTPILHEGSYDVKEVVELNFFDMTGEKANTKGTSNKFYHAELQVEKNGGRAQLFTMYGPTGKVQAREYRCFSSFDEAKKEMDKIIKSKEKKGYTRIDVAQRAIGSDGAKQITKPVVFKNAEHLDAAPKSSLNEGQRRIVDIFFGAQANFVAQTLKCPLGQLSNEQIDKGREALDKAKVIVNGNKRLSSDDTKEILALTNTFYATIPHNLGAGARGQMSHLLLDTLDKIVAKEGDLDTLLDAKQVNAVLKADSSSDDKYLSLNCDFDTVDPTSDLFKFLSGYFNDTKVRGHGYDANKVARIWSMKRKDAKEAAFIKTTERIGKENGRHTFASETESLSHDKSKLWVPEKRPDLDKPLVKLYNDANVWLCWHGTRSANLVGITRRGLMIRPTGAVYTGSLFGDGKYFAWQSTKSLNYCDGGYWTGGNRSISSRFMFLLDVSMGKQHKSNRSQFFKCPPNGYHSVYGKAGSDMNGGTLRNDEMITYDFNDSNNQSGIRYLLEIV
jgi:predicted DNA-binding WGR domain protein